jgi:hypothetical protein
VLSGLQKEVHQKLSHLKVGSCDMQNERPEYHSEIREILETLRFIVFQLGKLTELHRRSSRGMSDPTSAICSSPARRTGTGMRRLIKWLPMLEDIFPALRYLGPLVWLIIMWVAAYIVAAWKGFVPWFWSLLL